MIAGWNPEDPLPHEASSRVNKENLLKLFAI
jgi:hypothetical protein